MKKKALFATLAASLMCAAAAVTLVACGDDDEAPAATKYKVTYAGGGTDVTGTAPTEADHAKGEKFTLKENTFTYADHEFDGWTYGGNAYNAGAEFTMPESDVTFTAKWLEIFTVTYFWGDSKPEGAGADAALPEAKNLADGKSYALPTLAAADSYTFAGWKVGDTATVLAGGAQYTVTGDITLTAVFVREGYYTVTYSLGEHAAADVTLPTQEDMEKDAEVTLAEAPEAADGYKFAGWEVKQGETVVPVSQNKFTMPEGNVTITAKWERLYTVKFYESADATESTDIVCEASDKLGEVSGYPDRVTNANGFTVKEWAVKNNADVKVTADSLAQALVASATDGVVELVPASYHLEVGAKDHSNGYPENNVAWSTTVRQGEQVEIKGKMTSKGVQNHQTVVAYVFSNTAIASFFRADNYVLNQTNLESTEHWAITKDETNYAPGEYITTEPAHSVNLVKIFASCDITVTINWISDSKMILSIATTGNTAANNTLSSTSTYVIAPASGQSFASSYTLGLNAENSYAEFTALTRHTHDYGSDDICTEVGCSQVNPVHTVHKWVKGVCSVCQENCAHESANGNTCSVCGAAISSATPNVTAYNTTNFNSAILAGLTLSKGNVLVVSGTQTSAGASYFHSVLFEVPGEATFRTDQFGAAFGNMFEGGDWDHNGFGGSNKNTITGAVTKNDAVADGDYWQNVVGMKSNCNWTITVDYRNTDKLLVKFVLVGADSNTGYAGITYMVNFSIAFKSGQSPNSLTLQFGAENATGTFTNVTTYSWAE